MNRRRCPVCGMVGVVPIAYGYPVRETIRAAERGEVILGGCCITGNDPGWGCRACEARFDSRDGGRTLVRRTPTDRTP